MQTGQTFTDTGSSALHHRFAVGDIEVVVVPDGHRTFPLPDNFVTNASRAELNEALAAASMPADMMTIVFNPVLLKAGGRNVLIDTGNGPQPDPAESTFGHCLANLSAAGCPPAEINRVVITHFHGDHVNGLHTAEGEFAFPNADLFVPRLEWDFWMNDDEMARASPGRPQELFRNNRRIFDPLRDRVTLYDDGQEVASGVTAVATPGHSIGHSSFLVSSGSTSLFVQADVTNHPALFVAHPRWHAAFDQFPDLAQETRLRIYEMLVAERLPVQGFHHPLPSFSYVERQDSGFRLNAI